MLFLRDIADICCFKKAHISGMGEKETARYILTDGLTILWALHMLDVVQHVLIVVVTTLVNSQNQMFYVTLGLD